MKVEILKMNKCVPEREPDFSSEESRSRYLEELKAKTGNDWVACFTPDGNFYAKQIIPSSAPVEAVEPAEAKKEKF